MIHRALRPVFRAALVAGILLVAVSGATATETFRLDNGMEVVLKENHASPLVASVIFVKSGAKYETEWENGLTHLLEHLLFDGTVHHSREELDRGIRKRGGYINAFTRKDLTAFLVLLPRQHIEYGLATQADMLLNSVFPEDELAKERQVVIEEIRQSADAADYLAERFSEEHHLAGTGYDRPVIGYEPFITNIPREAIVDYWKRYYRPGRMTAMIIGSFEPDSMKAMLDRTFGAIVDSLGAYEMAAPDALGFSGETTEVDTVGEVSETGIDISFRGPSVDDSSYLALSLLAEYLSLDEISPLETVLLGGEQPLASELGVSHNIYEGFSQLDLHIITDQPDRADEVVDSCRSILGHLPQHSVSEDIIDGLVVSRRTSDILFEEKLHYYGFIIAPYIFNGGWEFIESRIDLMADLSWSDCQAAAEHWLAEGPTAVSIMRPAGEGVDGWQPTYLSAEEVIAHFDTATIPEHDLTGTPLTFPENDSLVMDWDDPAVYHIDTLENGLTVIVKSSPDSRVFAVNVLGEDRTINEPAGQAGITDFVNRMLEKGTVTRSASELSRDLAAIGAQVTLHDNPWIPYDDRYTTRRFSFARFELMEEFAEKGFHLFAEMLLRPSFDTTAIEQVRRSMLGLLGRESQSPRSVARDLLVNHLYGETDPMARPISGDARSIAAISRDDLLNHHSRFYAPQNTILAISTSHPVEVALGWVERAFNLCGAEGEPALADREWTEYLGEPDEAHTDLESEQVSIYMGCFLPPPDHADAPVIRLATCILSDRLFNNLREKQGLAYSVGAGVEFDRTHGVFRCAIGTGSENYDRARQGLKLEIEKLKLDGPTKDELITARNQLLARIWTRRLSRINQAYYLAEAEHLGLKLGYQNEMAAALGAATASDIRRVMARYFDTEAMVVASAGTRP